MLSRGSEGAYFSWQSRSAGPGLDQTAVEGSELPVLNSHHHSHIIFNSSARQSPPSPGDLARAHHAHGFTEMPLYKQTGLAGGEAGVGWGEALPEAVGG